MAYVAASTYTTGQLIGASDFNQQIRDNEAYLLNGRQLVKLQYLKGTNPTTASTTFVSMDTTNLRVTVPATASGRLLFWYTIQAGTTAATVQFRLSRDAGTEFSGDATNGDTGTQNTSNVLLAGLALFTSLTAATHTFDLQWRVSAAATATNHNTNVPITIIAYEV